MNVLFGSTPDQYYNFVKDNPKEVLSIFNAFDKDEESIEVAKLMLVLTERASGCLEAFTTKEIAEVILT